MIYIDLFFISLFTIQILVAIFYDLTKLEIPNLVCITIAISFLPAALLHGLDFLIILEHYGSGVLLFFGGLVLFILKVMGGGDVKLIAAIGIWLGWKLLVPYIIVIAIIGAGLALVVLVLRSIPSLSGPLKSLPWLSIENKDKKSIPYGFAIGVAGLILIKATAIGTVITNIMQG